MLSFLFAFLLFGMMFHFPIILADDNKTTTTTTTSDSGSSTTTTSDSGSSTTTTSNSGSVSTTSGSGDSKEKLLEAEKNLLERRQKFEEKAIERLKRLDEKIMKINEEALKKQFREDGKTVNVTREVSVDANGTKTITITRTIFNSDGTVFKTMTITNTIGADGEKEIHIDGEQKVHTDLNISSEFENDSNLEATTSDGEKHKIKVLPDEARQIIMERLKALNITNLTLAEIKHGNIPQAVYNVETNKHGRFLGIFKLALKVDSQVDPTTGEVLSVNKPWWGIFVIEQNEVVPPATNTTSTNTSA